MTYANVGLTKMSVVFIDLSTGQLGGHALQFFLAGISNMTAAAITNPVNVVKVRMQLDCALVAGQVRNADRFSFRSLLLRWWGCEASMRNPMRHQPGLNGSCHNVLNLTLRRQGLTHLSF
jgi:hypothetical protein